MPPGLAIDVAMSPQVDMICGMMSSIYGKSFALIVTAVRPAHLFKEKTFLPPGVAAEVTISPKVDTVCTTRMRIYGKSFRSS